MGVVGFNASVDESRRKGERGREKSIRSQNPSERSEGQFL